MNENEIDALRTRWDTPMGLRAMVVLLNPNCTFNENRQVFSELLGEDKCMIVSETFRGDGKFADLRGVDLSGKKLGGLWFGQCELSYSNFSNCGLSKASFGGAKMYFANFSRANSDDRVEFFEVFAQGANFSEVCFIDANFERADLRGANFEGAVFKNCCFSGALLQGVRFADVRMVNCEVNKTHLSAGEETSDWFSRSSFVLERIIWE